MGKFQRYYNKTEDESTEASKTETVVYNVDPKPRPWGRRQADKRIKKNKTNKIVVKIPNPNPKFKGKVPIPKELLKKHGRGEGINPKGVRTNTHQKRIEKKEKIIQFATKQAARAEVLLTEDEGFLEADAGETTTQFTQKQIAESVDITAATKSFELKLNDFGPYRLKYTKNGRHLLIGGKRGHVAAFDWVTKKLHCEMNVMESVHDICWLHIETMFAVAQKEWVYIYDNQGIELHCVKRLNRITRMEFLPYHFLLASCSDMGSLSWLDISIGQLVSQFNTNLGRLTMLSQNPWNAVLCVGHSKGVVSMWSPNSKSPLAKMLCHKAPLTALHVDSKGQFLATAASNRELKIWDVRKLSGPLQQYKLITAANNLNFSQKNMLALGMGNVVEVYRDCCMNTAKRPYLRHRFVTSVGNLNFCPYEDVLGVATATGVASLIVPGSGEPNFDALEANPFQSKSQRREAEVKSLLEKIQPELITLDPTSIVEVDLPTLKDKIEAKQKLLHVKPPKINFTPRNKAKGKGGSVKVAKNKKIVREQAKKEFIKNTKGLAPEFGSEKNEKEHGVLARFLPKKSKT
ncbi:WD repeat-containing protein 46 isoform X2 [Tribolium madens]|uniref:WD repeat-containing protein 46 isoform X2 n=1 Tax=Tribolium madens TaxID=41895 RepID=UPI001CF76131|nr:WD repeat-containing protein 46 isoform X2 [Tribolium madens]